MNKEERLIKFLVDIREATKDWPCLDFCNLLFYPDTLELDDREYPESKNSIRYSEAVELLIT